MDSPGSASTPPRQPSQVSPWLRVSRASQFDAAQNDESNMSMLKKQLKEVFLKMPKVFLNYEPELMACVRLCVWRFSIWVDKPTPGNASKGLRYRNEKAFQLLVDSGKVKTGLEGPGLTTPQKIGFLLAMVGVPYGWACLQRRELLGRTNQDTLKVMQFIEKFYKVANLANFLVFLNTGRYRSLAERVLNASLVYQRPNTIPIATSELMTRQLLWGELSELLLILLPYLKRMPDLLRFKWSSSIATLEEGACVLCAAHPITIPYVALPCRHLYCYYCLSTRYTSNRAFHCAACDTEVINMERFTCNEDNSTIHAPQE